MKFEEKKRLRREELAELFKGLGELIGSGKLRLGDSTLQLPEHAEVEIEYKEKEGRGKLEVEVKWARQWERQGSELSIAQVKQSIKRVFKDVRSALEAGEMPGEELLNELSGLSRRFQELAKGMEYEADLEGYMELVENLKLSVKAGELERAREAAERLRGAKKSCHKRYRWKEEP